MDTNNITIKAVSTLYPVFLERLALSTVSLQLFANRACLLDANDNLVSGSEVSSDSLDSMESLVINAVGQVVTVSYLNNKPSLKAKKMRVFNYNSATGVSTPLVDFAFDLEVSTPTWGLYSFSFNINFSFK